MDTFKQNIILTYGSEGKAWLDSLPHLVAALQTKWYLAQLRVAENLSYNYVLFGFQYSNPIVLKLT